MLGKRPPPVPDTKVKSMAKKRAKASPPGIASYFTPKRNGTQPRLARVRRKARMVRDAVHKDIRIPGACWEIIDTPEFQRLRHLKQLAMVYRVYPGAMHSRFEHSLGVCHLAGKMVDHFREIQGEDLHITDVDKLCVQIAGLCHDWGHGPFSHVFDGVLVPRLFPQSGWTHEKASCDMIDYTLKKRGIDLSMYGIKERDITFIKELIEPPPVEQRKGRGAEKAFLYDIVNNKHSGLDVDKFDYFQRDTLFTGIGRSDYSIDYIMSQSRVMPVLLQEERTHENCSQIEPGRDDKKRGKSKGEEVLHICYPEKCVRPILNFFRTRFDLHQAVYTHRVVKALEFMLVDALELANKHIRVVNSESIGGCIRDMSSYARLNDSITDVIHARRADPQLSAEARADLASACSILERMESRRLYKCIGKTHPNLESGASIDLEDIRGQIIAHSRGRLEKRDLILELVRIHYGAKEQNPLDFIYFFDKNSCSPRHVADYKYASQLPQDFQEIAVRAFCRDLSKCKAAYMAFQSWASRIGAPSPFLSFSQDR